MSHEDIKITDFFTEEELEEFVNKGNFLRGPCPHCGDGTGSLPFMLFLDKNTAYCHKSCSRFSITELVALKHGLITCSEGRKDKDDEWFLRGELYKDTVDIIRAEYGDETLDKLNLPVGGSARERLVVSDEFHVVSGNYMNDYRVELSREIITIYQGDKVLSAFEYKNITEAVLTKFASIICADFPDMPQKDFKAILREHDFFKFMNSLRQRYDEAYKEKTQRRRTTTPLKLDNYQDNVKKFHQLQPFFYDKAGFFWFWDLKENYWKLVDDTDVMIAVDLELRLGGQTITPKVKSSYLEAFKRVGRMNIPEEAPTNWVQFRDKIFDINAKKTFKATPKYFLTNPIPHELGENPDTPTMDKLFGEWVGGEFVQTLYEIIAYCCYSSYPIHLAFCLIGSGRNGKSQFQKIVTNFIGSGNITSTELDALSDSRFESFKLYKKLVCVLSETNFGVLKKTTTFKKLTGGDLIGFEAKNKNPFDDYSYATVIINSNSLPTSLDTSDGFYRRWLIIAFPNEFPEGKDIISSIPKIEYSNLACKVVEILPGLLEKGKFTNQGTIDQRRRNYIMSSNPAPFFLKLCCELGPDRYILTADLYNAYCSYLIQSKKRKVTRKEFIAALEDEAIFQKKTNKKIGGSFVNGYFCEGVMLRDDWNERILDNCDNCDNCAVLSHLDSYKEKEVKSMSQTSQLSQKKQNKRETQYYDHTHSKQFMLPQCTKEQVLAYVKGVGKTDLIKTFNQLGNGAPKILWELFKSGELKFNKKMKIFEVRKK